jgi:hypothetical protein
MLSHHEQTTLQNIAQQLEASDPALAEALRAGKVSGRPNMTTVWLVVLGVSGTLFLILGIIAASPSVGLCGVAALVAMASILMWRRSRKGRGKSGTADREAAPPV